MLIIRKIIIWRKRKPPQFFLYSLEPSIERLKKRNLKEEGKKEEYIEKLFSQNLENIFPNLLFLDTQVFIKDKKENNRRADTLAFDRKNNTFVVIEYKNEESGDLFHQAGFYLALLLNKEWIVSENRKKVKGILKKKFEERQEEWKEPQWENSYALCITTDIGKYEDWFKIKIDGEEPRVKLIEIEFYDNILWINCENLPSNWLQFTSSGKHERNGRNLTLPQLSPTISELIEAVEPDDPLLTQKWLEEIDKLVSEKLNLKKTKVSFVPYERKDGGGYIRNYIKYSPHEDSKKIWFSLVVWKNQINPYWNFPNPTKISPNLHVLLEDYPVEHKKEGHWGLPCEWHFNPIKTIKTNEDPQNKKNKTSEDLFEELKALIQKLKENFPKTNEIFR